MTALLLFSFVNCDSWGVTGVSNVGRVRFFSIGGVEEEEHWTALLGFCVDFFAGAV